MLTTELDPEILHAAPVTVKGLGTLQEPDPVSISPLSEAFVFTSIPVTVAVEIGLTTPETVKLNTPLLAIVSGLLIVTIFVAVSKLHDKPVDIVPPDCAQVGLTTVEEPVTG